MVDHQRPAADFHVQKPALLLHKLLGVGHIIVVHIDTVYQLFSRQAVIELGDRGKRRLFGLPLQCAHRVQHHAVAHPFIPQLHQEIITLLADAVNKDLAIGIQLAERTERHTQRGPLPHRRPMFPIALHAAPELLHRLAAVGVPHHQVIAQLGHHPQLKILPLDHR